MIGYIKLYRQIQECWLWNDGEKFDKRSAWIDLLLLANHEDKKVFFEGKLIVVKRGQFITSIQKLGERWKWDRKKVMKFLDVLESDSMLSQKRTTHGTTITIVNWDNFQVEGTTKRTTTTTTDGQRLPQPMDTNKNDKEYIKNDKNNKYADDDCLNNAIKDFIEHRRKLRKPMTDKAIELFIQRLNKFETSVDGQIRLINIAIERGWQTVYPAEDEKIPERKNNDKLKALEEYYMNGGE